VVKYCFAEKPPPYVYNGQYGFDMPCNTGSLANVFKLRRAEVYFSHEVESR